MSTTKHFYCPPVAVDVILSSAVSLMVALSWNSAARELVELMAPKVDGAKAKFIVAVIYAVMMTLFVIFIVYLYNNHLSPRTCVQLSTQETSSGEKDM
jgi:hypothetical protein